MPRSGHGVAGPQPVTACAALPRYVCIAMEALDQLLMACHCQSINLFVESFLKMVAKLLESEKPNLQILGTNSVRSGPGGSRSPSRILGIGRGEGDLGVVTVMFCFYLVPNPKCDTLLVLGSPFV